MHFELAEPAAHLDMLPGVEMLIADHDHLVLDQRRLQCLVGRGVQALLEVEAVDFGAELRAQAFDLERRCVVLARPSAATLMFMAC